MCGGNIGRIVGTVLAGPLGYLAGKKLIDEPAKQTRMKAARARGEIENEAARLQEAEEKKRRQRKATATVATSGQGLGVDGGSLGE